MRLSIHSDTFYLRSFLDNNNVELSLSKQEHERTSLAHGIVNTYCTTHSMEANMKENFRIRMVRDGRTVQDKRAVFP